MELQEQDVGVEEPKRKGKNGSTHQHQSAPLDQMVRDEDLDVAGWLKNLSTEAPIRVKVMRIHPKIWAGKPVSGYLGVFEEFLDESDISEQFGGGRFAIQVQRQNKQGKFVYLTQKTIEIAGDPKIVKGREEDGGSGLSSPAAPLEDTSLQKQALAMTERMAMEERRRNDDLLREIREDRGMDATTVAAFTKPYELQVQALQETIRSLQGQITDLLAKRGEKGPNDVLLEKLLLDEQSRLAAIRTSHESELRAVREGLMQDLKRAEDRSDRMVQTLEHGHQREIDNLRMSYEARIENLKSTHSSESRILQSEMARKDADLAEMKKEIVDLRAKKDVPLPDQLAQLIQLKEMMGSVFSGGEGEETSTADKIIEAITNIGGPVAQSIAGRLAGPVPNEVALVPSAVASATAAPPVAAAEVPRRQKGPPKPVIDKADVQAAVMLLEQAITNDMDPMVFLQSVGSMIPATVIETIKMEGLDHFLDSRVKLSDTSPIRTQKGLNFLRKVWTGLTGEPG